MRAASIRDMVNSPATLIRLTDGAEIKGWVDSIDLPRCSIRIRTKLDLKSGERFQIAIKGLTERCDFVGRLLVQDTLDQVKNSAMSLKDGVQFSGEAIYEFTQDGVVVFGKSKEDPRKALHEHYATFEWNGKKLEAGLAEVGLGLAVLIVPTLLRQGDALNLEVVLNRKAECFPVTVDVVDEDSDYEGLYRIVVKTENLNRIEAAAWRRLLDLAS